MSKEKNEDQMLLRKFDEYEMDEQKKLCYTCKKQGECNPLQDDISCDYEKIKK